MKQFCRIGIAVALGVVCTCAWGQTGTQRVSSVAEVLTPKESMETLKVQVQVEKERELMLQANAIEVAAKQQEAPLQQQYDAATKAIREAQAAVRKKNGWGDDVSVDMDPRSPTFGEWVRTATEAAQKKK